MNSCAIADYGLIGNSRSAALVSRTGSIDWCCLPVFDSASVFGAVLDSDKGGCFRISPVASFDARLEYLQHTNVLENTFETPTGQAKLLDCFTVATEAEKKEELWPEHEILRVVECQSGVVDFEMRFFPRPDYGSKGAKLSLSSQGSNHKIECRFGLKLLILQISGIMKRLYVDYRQDGDEAIAVFRLEAGEKAAFSLGFAEKEPAVVPAMAGFNIDRRLQRSLAFWRRWVRRCQYAGPYREQVLRSALALKLLAYAPSGAIIGAPTTSLPEVVGGERNWDYRFCWLRDASFTARALLQLGYVDEARSYMVWVLYGTRLTRPRLQVVYSVYGNTKLHEKKLEWLQGYRGSRPVRIGNGAIDQTQLDVYGEVLNGLHALMPFMDKLDFETKHLVLDLAYTVIETWELPDHGIWEMRGEPVHFTHSKVLAWVALNRAIDILEHFQVRVPLEFRATADKIKESIEERAYSRTRQSYVREFDGHVLDASLLALPLVGYCDPSTIRMKNTVAAIEASLGKNGLIYRYEPRSDGLQGVEGAFGICNFWMAEVMARSGDPRRARFWIDSILKHLPSTGLCSEEIDPESGELLGNFPQGFSHIGLINSAVALAQAEASLRGIANRGSR